MFRFIIGLLIGAVGAVLFIRSEYARRLDIETRIEDAQDRASEILAESRRVLEESREQLNWGTGDTIENA